MKSTVVGKSLLFLALAAVTLFGSPSRASAAEITKLGVEPHYYSFHPNSPLSLGATFDPADLSRTRGQPYNFEIEDVDTGAISTEFEMFAVRSTEDLKSAFHFDASIDAHFLFGNFSARFGTESRSATSSSSITIVVNAISELGRRRIRSVTLKPDVQQLLAAGGEKDKIASSARALRERFGTDYVFMERRGAMLSAVITIANVSADTYSKIYGGVSGGGFGFSAQAAFDTELSKRTDRSQISIRASALGGLGFGDLGSKLAAFKDPTSLESVKTSLAEALKGFPPELGAPLGYFTSSLTDLGLPANETPWSDERQRNMLKLARYYRTARQRLDAIEAINNKTDPRWELLPSDFLAKLDGKIKDLGTYITGVVTAYEQARASLPIAMPEKPTGDDSFVGGDASPSLAKRAVVLLKKETGGIPELVLFDSLASDLIFSQTDSLRDLYAREMLATIRSSEAAVIRKASVSVATAIVSSGQLLRKIDIKPHVPVTAVPPASAPFNVLSLTTDGWISLFPATFDRTERRILLVATQSTGTWDQWQTALAAAKEEEKGKWQILAMIPANYPVSQQVEGQIQVIGVTDEGKKVVFPGGPLADMSIRVEDVFGKKGKFLKPDGTDQDSVELQVRLTQ